MRQVRAVVERQPAPAVHYIDPDARVGEQRAYELVQTVIVPAGAVGDVPWCLWVVKLVWICVGVGDWCVMLVSVDVAGQDEVDRVVEEDRFENVAAVFADVGAVVLEADVPRWASEPGQFRYGPEGYDYRL
jgi:hypothetical protein